MPKVGTRTVHPRSELQRGRRRRGAATPDCNCFNAWVSVRSSSTIRKPALSTRCEAPVDNADAAGVDGSAGGNGSRSGVPPRTNSSKARRTTHSLNRTSTSGIAFVTWALARVARTPSARNYLLLGILTGLSVLAYPATHVLGPAIIGAVIVQQLLTSAAPRNLIGALRARMGSIIAALIGFTLAAGPQIYFWTTRNYESRARSQLIFLPGPRKHIEYSLGGPATDWDIILFNLKHTLLFFWAGDKAAQYGYTGAPLGPIMSWVAVTGGLVLIFHAARKHLVSTYVILACIATLVGSVLMVEGSFSPHLIIFALIMPLACAIACDTAWRCIRITQPYLVAPCMLLVGAWWAHWNYEFYETSVKRWKLYRVTYILNLPIETRKVKTLLSLTNTPESLGESFYVLTFPNATRTTLQPPQDEADIIVAQGAKTGFPALAIIELDREASVVGKLTAAGHNPQIFRHTHGIAVYVE